MCVRLSVSVCCEFSIKPKRWTCVPQANEPPQYARGGVRRRRARAAQGAAGVRHQRRRPRLRGACGQGLSGRLRHVSRRVRRQQERVRNPRPVHARADPPREVAHRGRRNAHPVAPHGDRRPSHAARRREGDCVDQGAAQIARSRHEQPQDVPGRPRLQDRWLHVLRFRGHAPRHAARQSRAVPRKARGRPPVRTLGRARLDRPTRAPRNVRVGRVAPHAREAREVGEVGAGGPRRVGEADGRADPWDHARARARSRGPIRHVRRRRASATKHVGRAA